MKALFGTLLVVAVIGAAVLFIYESDDPVVTSTSTQVTQPTPGGTEPQPPQALRRVQLDGWTWDAASITLTVTNTGDAFVSGTAQCRVEWGASGVMWPQMPLPGLQPGESVTRAYTDLWAAGNVPSLVPECVIVDP